MGQVEWDRYAVLQSRADFIWVEDGETNLWRLCQDDADQAYEEYEIAAGLTVPEIY